MMTTVDRFVRFLSSKRAASIAIYFGMVQYAALWILPEFQAQLLAIGLVFYGLRVPYFLKIGERAFVAQSVFFFCVEFVALLLAAETKGLPWMECYAIR